MKFYVKGKIEAGFMEVVEAETVEQANEQVSLKKAVDLQWEWENITVDSMEPEDAAQAKILAEAERCMSCQNIIPSHDHIPEEATRLKHVLCPTCYEKEKEFLKKEFEDFENDPILRLTDRLADKLGYWLEKKET